MKAEETHQDAYPKIAGRQIETLHLVHWAPNLTSINQYWLIAGTDSMTVSQLYVNELI